MRAIGVILVILNHTWPWPGSPPVVFPALSMAWMLLDTFFVLSGFLITGILLDTRERPDYYKSFFIRRAFRILPIYYAVLIFITVVAVFNGHAGYKDMLAHWGSPAWFYVYLGNIPTALTGAFPLAGGRAFEPLWSLQVEEQFYLLFPLLIHKLPLKTLWRVLLGLCCFSTGLRLLIYWLHPENELAQYVLFPCRMEGLAIGALIAIRFRQGPWEINKRRLSNMVMLSFVITIICIYAGGLLNTTPLNRTVGLLLSPIFSGFVVLWIIRNRNTGATAWLRTPALEYLGKISYAAYMLHWPIANMLTVILKRLGLAWLDAGFPRLGMIYLVTFAVSALSWHYFETPIQRLRDRIMTNRKKAALASSV